jgi:hypothetical protein
MSTLQLSPSITVTTPDGTRVEFATLVIPEDGWEIDGHVNSYSSPADRAILEAELSGWRSVGSDDNYVDDLDVSVITFWRKAQA